MSVHGTDAGYEAAREMLRQIEQRRASIVRRQITELLNVIDQRIERAMQRAEAIGTEPGHDGERDIAGLAGDTGKIPVENADCRADEAAHGIDPDIKIIEAILNYRKAIFAGLGHEVSPVIDGEQVVADNAAAQPVQWRRSCIGAHPCLHVQEALASEKRGEPQQSDIDQLSWCTLGGANSWRWFECENRASCLAAHRLSGAAK